MEVTNEVWTRRGDGDVIEVAWVYYTTHGVLITYYRGGVEHKHEIKNEIIDGRSQDGDNAVQTALGHMSYMLVLTTRFLV